VIELALGTGSNEIVIGLALGTGSNENVIELALGTGSNENVIELALGTGSNENVIELALGTGSNAIRDRRWKRFHADADRSWNRFRRDRARAGPAGLLARLASSGPRTPVDRLWPRHGRLPSNRRASRKSREALARPRKPGRPTGHPGR
jgi:hypothetical protein